MDDLSSPEGDSCFICGYDNENGLETHHLVPRRYGGSDEPENLVTLCATCHSSIEKLYDDGFYGRLHMRQLEVMDASDREEFGRTVDAQESLDRKIPKNSPHVTLVHGEEEPEGVDKEVVLEFCLDLHKREPAYIVEIHCGYCPTVFEPWDHAGAARHLRLAHHIRDPYETFLSDSPDRPWLPRVPSQ